MSALLDWLEATSFAKAVGGSATLTAWLSAIHVLGFTLVTGSALVANLRGLGVLLPRTPIGAILRPAHRAVVLGLAISVSTGALLFSARATEVAANDTFRLKMLLLIAAAAFQLTFVPSIAKRDPAAGPGTSAQFSVSGARATAAVALVLWLGLALAACAFILLE